MDKLTIKQEKFVQGLFTGLSQREAYKQAFSCSKMADKTIDEASSRLANNSKVITRLEQLRNELKDKNMLTVQKVIDELSNIAFDDISNYLDYRTEKTVIDHDDNGNPITEHRTIVDLKDSRTIDTRNVKSVSIGNNGVFKFEQYCKDTALFKLGEHLGMFKQNINILGGLDNTNTDLTNMTAEERKLRIVELTEKMQER